jgi:hypothetical protein
MISFISAFCQIECPAAISAIALFVDAACAFRRRRVLNSVCNTLFVQKVLNVRFRVKVLRRAFKGA